MGDASREVQENYPVVYVTGFGPFSSHPINASQVAVEKLVDQGLESDLGMKLVTEIVKVEYDYVKETVPRRWKELNPKLVVHVGMSGMAEALTLEQLAHNHDYARPDNCGRLPQRGCCCPDGDQVLQSGLRMDLISSKLNKMTHLKLPCAKSTDPGRYLCDFIYYLSLNEDQRRVAFIHIPPLSKFSSQEMSASIAAAIKEMYQQVLEMDAMEEKEVEERRQ